MGPTHGDFTAANVLAHCSTNWLIDLEYADMAGPILADPINFALDRVYSKLKRPSTRDLAQATNIVATRNGATHFEVLVALAYLARNQNRLMPLLQTYRSHP